MTKNAPRTNKSNLLIINDAARDSGTQTIVEQALAERFLDEKQVAERWGVSLKLLQKMRQQGGGPQFVRIGRAIRYPLSVIVNYEKEQTYSNTSEQAK